MSGQPPQPEISASLSFALLLESACEQFEVLQRLIRGETGITSTNDRRDSRAFACIQMALAKSFVFNVVRAYRICEHGARSLDVDRAERGRFLRSLRGVLQVRDVNEHGFDQNISSRGKNSKPSMHTHQAESAILDETSMIVLGDTKILMGPLNLYDVYGPVARMRDLAGFMSLPAVGSGR